MMSVLSRLASAQGQRSDLPNQALARELAAGKDKKAIREVAQNLQNKDRNIQSDCLKVLYEIGYLEPGLIAAYAGDFLKLLGSRNNRLVWGGLIALSTIASQTADELFPHWRDIQTVMDKGTVITVDAGVKTLAQVAAQTDAYRIEILPFLLEHLRTCRPQSVAQHAEAIAVAVDVAAREAFVEVLTRRLEDLTVAAANRVRRVIAKAGVEKLE
jgi:hypothetical protein